MKKYLVLLLLAILTACAPPTTRGSRAPSAVEGLKPPTVSEAISKALDSTIILYDLNYDLVCAGQRVDDTRILLAYHCVEAAVLTNDEYYYYEELGRSAPPAKVLDQPVSYSTYNDVLAGDLSGEVRLRDARISAIDPLNDVAVISTAPSADPRINVRFDRLLVGEPVFAIGHPYGLEYSYTRGYVSNQCRRLADVCYTQVDITIWGGSSGGALYDMNGDLVGVASRRIGSGFAFFVPPKAIKAILHQ